MKTNRLLFFAFCAITISHAQQIPPVTNGWVLFSRVKFSSELFKELNEYFLVPQFDDRIRKYENEEILIKGHYLPVDTGTKNSVIISKVPYAACFFCGGAGPESVAEVQFETEHPRFKPDQVIQVSGKLVLNKKDVNHMNFILKEARLVP